MKVWESEPGLERAKGSLMRIPAWRNCGARVAALHVWSLEWSGDSAARWSFSLAFDYSLCAQTKQRCENLTLSVQLDKRATDESRTGFQCAGGGRSHGTASRRFVCIFWNQLWDPVWFTFVKIVYQNGAASFPSNGTIAVYETEKSECLPLVGIPSIW